eukprot:TRINITY_DN11281_c0_g1_i2.p1 TRINITY_DN11281_c0_g1~~TRINITY_DN11281_c0_g1_i2.p1  ORF type:complete len:920 (+),score=172.70 TRINITY_DN11281_c0_g1_i2:44-2803(+)
MTETTPIIEPATPTTGENTSALSTFSPERKSDPVGLVPAANEDDVNYLKKSGAALFLERISKALIAEKPENPIKGLLEIAERTWVKERRKSPSESHVKETKTMVVGEDEDGSKKINEYAVVTELGRGAYGKVKLVVHVQTEQYFAIKIMKKSVLQKARKGGGGDVGACKTALDSVRLEIAIMKKVDHPNICKLYEVINDESCNKLYLIIEYIEEGPCYTLEDGCTPMETTKLRKLCIGIAQGLDYLHQIGVIHRDIKPENILVDSQGTPKLTDFGVANDFGDDGGSSEMVQDTSGTPAFFSPELFNQVPASGNIHDIWAFGVTLYVMAYAALPFLGNNLTAVCHSVTKTEPSWDQVDVDPDAKDLIQKLLFKEFSRRLGTETGIPEILNHKFLAGHEGAARQNHTEINISETDRDKAVLKGDNINLKFSSTVGVMIKIKGKFRTYARRSLPNSPAEAPPLDKDEGPLTEVVHPTAQQSFREANEVPEIKPELDIGSQILLTGAQSVVESGSDDEVETPRKLATSSTLAGKSALGGFLPLPSKLSPGNGLSSGHKRSFRTEEDVIMESQAKGDLESVIQKALADGQEDLTLNCYKFDELPDSLFSCGGLLTLKAHLNGLKSISPKIDHLQMLTTINLGQNELASLPDAIGELSSLTSLDCNRNKLECLPDSIANLTDLKYINLDYNNIKGSLPACLPKIQGLEKCFIIGNQQLVSFTSGMGNWTNCNLAVDNTPVLKIEWGKIHKGLENVILMWNKVYPDQVLDHLYLGSVRTVQSENILKELEITRIVTAGKQLEIIDPLPEGVDQLLLNVEDIPEQGLRNVFSSVNDYIEKVRKEKRRVLVHCFAGLSRSVTFVCAYLIKKYGMTFKDAITFVKKARPNANPNQGFRDQLIEYEKDVHGTVIDPNDKECKANGPGVEG